MKISFYSTKLFLLENHSKFYEQIQRRNTMPGLKIWTFLRILSRD